MSPALVSPAGANHSMLPSSSHNPPGRTTSCWITPAAEAGGSDSRHRGRATCTAAASANGAASVTAFQNAPDSASPSCCDGPPSVSRIRPARSRTDPSGPSNRMAATQPASAGRPASSRGASSAGMQQSPLGSSELCQAAISSRTALSTVRPGSSRVAAPLRPWQDLDRHLRQRRQCPERAGQQLAEIVSRHVLDHVSAGLERLAAAAHGAEPEEMVAGAARAHPA